MLILCIKGPLAMLIEAVCLTLIFLIQFIFSYYILRDLELVWVFTTAMTM